MMKKVVKKLVVLFLVVVLALGLAACSGQKEAAPVQTGGNDPALEAYIDKNGDEFIKAFDSSFSQSSGGMECKSTIKVEGTSIVVDCLLKGIDNIPDEAKAQMQTAMDATKDTLKTGFEEIKKEVSTLTDVKMNICEEDGDKLATVEIKF